MLNRSTIICKGTFRKESFASKRKSTDCEETTTAELKNSCRSIGNNLRKWSRKESRLKGMSRQ